MKKENENEKVKPNAMDVYNFLWRGRDIELAHIWHRSIFFAVFIMGITSIYAIYFKDIFIHQFIKKDLFDCTAPMLVFGLIPIAITVIGIIFSMLWIMMAKGSKAWYEIYEDSIAKISDIDVFWDHQSIKNIYGDSIKELIFGKLSLKKETKCDKCLFSTNGGQFSVSKINIMIGIVFFILYIGLFIFHIGWMIRLYSCNHIPTLNCICFIISCFIIAGSICFICCFITKKVSSSYLNKQCI
ncbi:hypothetical protein [Treponema denticola]|uniref:RipA family octameric membrane protein n=1 Tax=Treponema denticola TaxID=158 RepID=UPI003D92AE9F